MMTTSNRTRGILRQTRRGNWLIGCGIALAVVLLLLIGAGVFIAVKWRDFAASGMSSGMTQLIAEMPIDDAEKAETQLVVDDFIERFRTGAISLEQLGRVIEQVAESPVLPAGVAMGVGNAYFKDSGLSEEEKVDGRLQLTRLAYGLADETVDTNELRVILAPLRADPGDTEVIQFDLQGQNIRMKVPQNTTDEELREFIEAARASADSNGLPETPPPFDLSGELDAAIKRALDGRADTVEDDGIVPAPAVPPGEPGEPDETPDP